MILVSIQAEGCGVESVYGVQISAHTTSAAASGGADEVVTERWFGGRHSSYLLTVLVIDVVLVAVATVYSILTGKEAEDILRGLSMWFSGCAG